MMTRIPKLCLPIVVASLILGCVELRAEGSTSIDPNLQTFVKQHCFDCHGADLQEAGLRLDQLSPNLDGEDVATKWAKIFDKVASGKMPPKDHRPPAEEIRQFTQKLKQTLHTVSLSQQQREGRVLMRRLNRNEYETTLQDLLGPQVEVKDLLPDDNIAAGFDKISAVLDISAVHLLRYQEAAQRAVRSALPNREPVKLKVRLTGREITEKVKTFPSYLNKSMRLDGDRLILHVKTYNSVPCASERVKEQGRYRVRASVSTTGTNGAVLPVLITHSGYQSPEVIADRRVRDVPAGKTTILTEEFQLDNREIVIFNGWNLPSPRDLAKRKDVLPLENYPGPGLIIDWIEIEGPLDEFPPSGYRLLFGDVPLKRKFAWNPASLVCSPEKPHEDAERLIRSVLPVIFRRPVEESLINYFVGIAHENLDKGTPFSEAMVTAYTAIFCSPNFLYLNEPLKPIAENSVEKFTGDRSELDDYAIASRLSYLLWSSTPDAKLLELAGQKSLRMPEVLHAQVERMLKDPKAKRFTENFAGQWLELRNINATVPDPRVYGEFDEELFWSMPRETELFFDEVLSRNLPLHQFVDSDWTYLNERLAQHYGIPGVVGGELRKVNLPENSHRGGVLTQAAILKITADGSRTSPVLRGKWVLEQILGQAPDPPPPNTPAIEPDVRGTTTIREQLDKHRNIAACAACHNQIDPPGFALESFDAIGGLRTFYRGTTKNRVELTNYPGQFVSRGADVELGGRMPDGESFHDIDEYKQLVLKDQDQLARNLAEKLLIYATGADLQFADREVVEQLVADSRSKNYGFRSLLHAVVQSRLFLQK